MKAQRNFADDVPAQQAIRYLLTDADQKLQKGYKPDGPLFERLFPVAGYETKLNLIASDTQLADVDHFFYASGTGAAGAPKLLARTADRTNAETAERKRGAYSARAAYLKAEAAAS